ncbi:MAG: cell division protein SepF [Clostridia bacterium]|nr:cell division protein SepF [Clostridia bacterium]
MGLFSRFRKNNFEDTDEFEDEDYEVQEETVDIEANATLEGSALELKIFKPTNMVQLLPAVDHLRAGKTVLLNLEEVEGSLCRRMIDFISGAAYAMKLTIKKATGNSYCIAPNDVNVSGETFENSSDDADEFFDI